MFPMHAWAIGEGPTGGGEGPFDLFDCTKLQHIHEVVRRHRNHPLQCAVRRQARRPGGHRLLRQDIYGMARETEPI